MFQTLIRHGKGAVAALSVLLAACGGGGGGDTGPTPDPTSPSLAQRLAAAAAAAGNDTSSNSSASFAVLQSAGVPAMQAQGPAKVNFAVFSDGKLVTNLTLENVSFALAKLVPGSSGNPDRWVSYVSRTVTPTPGVGPNGNPVLASAKQATTDPKHTDAALAARQLVAHPAGYYTYTFRTDIKDPGQTAGVAFEPNLTHRVAIQLSYLNAAGETVRVNPYFDFRFDANGNSVVLADPATQTRKMTDVASCNSCHEKLALHGGGRLDTQYCVMCHNPGTTDPNSGNVLTLSTMAHKIHAGRLLKKALDEGKGGEDYAIWGYQDRLHDYAEVGFPQDLRNCTKCHTGANPKTPQGDLWKTSISKEACLTCHASRVGSDWEATHKVLATSMLGSGAQARDLTNAMCASCHKAGSAISPERVHWNQNEEHAAKYRMNIESAVYDPATRKVKVRYFLSDPTRGNAAYNLVTPDCTGAAPNICSDASKFGNLRLIVAYNSLAQNGRPVTLGATEFSSYNNPGSRDDADAYVPTVYAYQGTNDGSNHYTAEIAIPPDTATHVASGTARVISSGQVKEPLLEVKTTREPRPEASPRTLINVVVHNTFKEFALTGTVKPRRTIVSSEKCGACHGLLGSTSGSNTMPNAFHRGARNIVESCVVCHDANRASSTVMTNGLDLNESYQFKRMIHGIHGNSKRTYPFTHGNRVVDVFGKDGASLTGGLPLDPSVTNFAAEVAWPGATLNCNACHVNNSYKVDRDPLGSVVKKPAGATDPLQWLVVSPKAASCTSCHDSAAAIGHVTSFGQGSFGDRTQAQSLQREEICADCHAAGGFKGVDFVHGLK